MAASLHEVGDVVTSTRGSDALAALVDAVRAAVVNRTPLAIRGGGTKAWYGHRGDGLPLDARAHSGIVDYEPSELVLVARAGTPLVEIEAVLAQNRQMLAFEPPHFATTSGAPPMSSSGDSISRAMAARGATLGGCVAAGLSGPRRMAAGAVRDFVLGARLIDGRAQPLAFGGKVMKNVAGYDVSRALVGSLGMLGVITEVSIKTLPLPVRSATLSFTLDERTALDTLNQWAGQPIAITASAWQSRPPDEAGGESYASHGGTLTVRLEGSEAAVQSGIRRIGGLDVEPAGAAAFWRGLREQTADFFGRRAVDAPLWRLALPPTSPPLDATLLGFDAQLVEWGGALRWISTRVDPQVVRDAATRLGGHATLWQASNALKTRIGVFAPLSAPLMAIHKRLKAEFDPDRIFNRGRLHPDL